LGLLRLKYSKDKGSKWSVDGGRLHRRGLVLGALSTLAFFPAFFADKLAKHERHKFRLGARVVHSSGMRSECHDGWPDIWLGIVVVNGFSV
jgi:hypothetical protein